MARRRSRRLLCETRLAKNGLEEDEMKAGVEVGIKEESEAEARTGANVVSVFMVVVVVVVLLTHHRRRHNPGTNRRQYHQIRSMPRR